MAPSKQLQQNNYRFNRCRVKHYYILSNNIIYLMCTILFHFVNSNYCLLRFNLIGITGGKYFKIITKILNEGYI